MIPRSLALLLAFVFFWSNVTAPGQAESMSSVSTSASLTGLQSKASSAQDEQHRPSDNARHDEPAGPIDDHPLSEQAAQFPIETGLESPALLARRVETQACLLTMAGPAPQLLAIWLAPHLEGLRRPPRSAGPTA